MATDAPGVGRPAGASRRFERWLELIPWCQREQAGMPLARLAEQLGDTERAVLRDVQALVEREYNLPGSFGDSVTILIERERVRLDSPGHFERPVRFSPLEALAVQLGLQIVLAESPEEDQATLEAATAQLADTLSPVAVSTGAPGAGGADEAASSEVTDAAESGNPSSAEDAAAFAYSGPLPDVSARVHAELRDALREGRVVELRYFKPHEPDNAPARRVAPWALAAVGGRWYLLGHELNDAAPKLFRLDRILEATATEERADAPSGLQVEDYIDPERVYRGDEDDLEVAIRYSPRIARWIEEHHSERAERPSDGSVVVRHQCKSPWWAVGWALRYGADARIIAPPSVRALMTEVIKGMSA